MMRAGVIGGLAGVALAAQEPAITGGTLKLAYSDCGDKATHGKFNSLSPTTVKIGAKTPLKGKGTINEAIKAATYEVEAKALSVTVFKHSGDACKAETIKLPKGAGTINMHGFKCPLAKGNVELDLDLSLSGSIPASLARVTIDLKAKTSTGDKALCAQIKTSSAAERIEEDTEASNPAIVKKGVTIGGLKCDAIQTGTVFYPSDTSKKYPLLAFAHGWTEGGMFTDGNYRDVLETVAASGYVVIAHHSGLLRECQAIYPLDQQRALAFIKETPAFSNLVDWNIKAGIYGHSMGGGATGDNAARADVIKKFNLGAAVLLHPVFRYTKTLIPSFYATGSADTICAPSSTAGWSKAASKPMIFAEMAGANHFECQSKEDGIPCPAGWTNYVVNWFNCHLKGQSSECVAANAVCTHPTKPMTATRCAPNATDLTDTVVV